MSIETTTSTATTTVDTGSERGLTLLVLALVLLGVAGTFLV